jgi:hypothetical protein
LNKETVKDWYPLTLISTVLEKLAEDRWFSMIDLQWGFNNVRICEGEEHKAAFITEQGLFELLVMQFRLCNSLVTFQ